MELKALLYPTECLRVECLSLSVSDSSGAANSGSVASSKPASKDEQRWSFTVHADKAGVFCPVNTVDTECTIAEQVVTSSCVTV